MYYTKDWFKQLLKYYRDEALDKSTALDSCFHGLWMICSLDLVPKNIACSKHDTTTGTIDVNIISVDRKTLDL